MSQADGSKFINMKCDGYGRYERNEVKPTIEVSLDYLVGKTDLALDSMLRKYSYQIYPLRFGYISFCFHDLLSILFPSWFLIFIFCNRSYFILIVQS